MIRRQHLEAVGLRARRRRGRETDRTQTTGHRIHFLLSNMSLKLLLSPFGENDLELASNVVQLVTKGLDCRYSAGFSSNLL